MDDHPRRGDVFFAFLDPVLGCEQGGTRPVLVVQNDAGNRRSKTIIVAAITGKPKANLPVHVPVPASAGLREGSVALLEQLRTIDKLRLRGRAGHIGAEQMRLVDAALAVSLGLKGPGDDFMLLTLCQEVPSDVLRLGRLPGVARGLRAGATRALHHLQYPHRLRLQGREEMTARPFVPCQACDAENRIVSRSAEMAHYERRAEAAFDDEALCGADPGGLFLPALEPYPYMMTPCQIAEFTGLTSQGVRKLLAAGEMRGVKFGSKWLVPKLCLLRYLNRREDGGENDEDAQMRQARGSR